MLQHLPLTLSRHHAETILKSWNLVLKQHHAHKLCSFASVSISVKLQSQLLQHLINWSCKPGKGYCAVKHLRSSLSSISTLHHRQSFRSKHKTSAMGLVSKALAKIHTQRWLMLLLHQYMFFPLTHLSAFRPRLSNLLPYFRRLQELALLADTRHITFSCMSQPPATGETFFVIAKELNGFEAGECFGDSRSTSKKAALWEANFKRRSDKTRVFVVPEEVIRI